VAKLFIKLLNDVNIVKKILKTEIKRDYSFIASGSRLTEELTDFLKGTGSI